MNWIDPNDLKAIRQQADIVEVIAQYLTLEKKGRSYEAICPFHDDHDPSLKINQEKQIFKCFVCQEGGDVFSFVQKMENVTYPEAIIKVAEMIGYPLNVSPTRFKPKENVNQHLFDSLNTYIRFLHYELKSEDGMLAMDYLNKRKINGDVIKRFEIGYAPSIERNTKFLVEQNISGQLASDIGVLNGGRAVFHDRITIPIHDENGNPLGFTARTLSTDKQVPKYINTAQTKIYEKGNVVFNYHRAKEFAKKNKRCILTEGAMDVLAFEKADIHYALACLGTACTPQQLTLLKRLRVPIILCYDGDKAGINATYKFIKMAVANHVDVQVVKNDTGKDPDEIFDEKGKEGLISFVSTTISPVDFLFDNVSIFYNLDNYDDRVQFGKEMFTIINATCQVFEKPMAMERLQALTGYDFSKLEVKKPNVPSPTHPSKRIPIQPLENENGRFKAEKVVLSMMLVSKMACDRFKDEVGYFNDSRIRDLANYIYDAYRSYPRLDYDILLARIDDDATRNFFISIWQDPLRHQSFDEDYLNDGLNKIKSYLEKDELDKINRNIKEASNAEERAKWFAEKKNYFRRKQNKKH